MRYTISLAGSSLLLARCRFAGQAFAAGPDRWKFPTATPRRSRSRSCRSRSRARRAAGDRRGRRDPRRPEPLRPVPRAGQERHRRIPDARRGNQVPDLAHAQAGLHRRRPRSRRPPAATCASNSSCITVGNQQQSAAAGDQRPAQRPARRRAPGRRPGLREDHRRARRVLDAHRLRHLQGHRQQHRVRADGRRFRRLQSADRGQFAPAADVAGMVAGWAQARLRVVRARQFLDLHPGNRHRFARSRFREQGHQRCAGVFAGRHASSRWRCPTASIRTSTSWTWPAAT